MNALETLKEKANSYETVDALVIEEFDTYEKIGDLFASLLGYFGGSEGYDERVVEFLRPMIVDYFNDTI